LLLTSRSTRAASFDESGTYGQQGPGHSGRYLLLIHFKVLASVAEAESGRLDRFFCPAARIAAVDPQMRPA
jgi:hypothetical protein